MKKSKAFTLAEAAVVLIVILLLVIVSGRLLKPGKLKQDAMIKASRIVYNELAVATMDIQKKYSKRGDLSELYKTDKSTIFKITDSGVTNDLLALYKSRMKLSRNTSSLTYAGYSGNYKLKNGAFFALKLYGNCTTTTTTYNPMYDNKEDNSYEVSILEEYDTCGAIFYDINDNDTPNELGKDRYIVAFDRDGLR